MGLNLPDLYVLNDAQAGAVCAETAWPLDT